MKTERNSFFFSWHEDGLGEGVGVEMTIMSNFNGEIWIAVPRLGRKICFLEQIALTKKKKKGRPCNITHQERYAM